MTPAKEMLFLQLPLLLVLLPGGNNEDGGNSGNYPALNEPNCLLIIKIFSFYNHSMVQHLSSGWLDGFEVYGWDRSSKNVTFLLPWSKGNLTNKEWEELRSYFSVFSFVFPLVLRSNVKKWQLEYPFEIQIAAGCEWHFGEDLVNFIRIAYDGSDLLSYQNNSWVPSPKGGSRAQQVWELFEKSKISQEITDGILPDFCPRLLLSLLDAGKADLQRQVKPKAWLSSGPSPGPGRLLLVCHISGFHPKPVWAVWTRGKQEQPSMQRSDVLPHVDHTWYLRVTLEVAAREAVGLACRVRHSSLGGQDLLLYWEQNHSKDLTILAVMVPLVLLTVGLLFWSRKHWKCCGLRPSSSFPLE